MEIQTIIDMIEQYADEKAQAAEPAEETEPQETGETVDFDPLIRKHAKAFSLDPGLVHGVIMKESAGEQFAARFEPEYKWIEESKGMKPGTCSSATETTFQKISIGLMQVMGGVYRQYGYKGWLSALFADPDLQIYYGCKHLSAKIKKYGLEAGIAAYNSGSPVKLANGLFKNQSYVLDVLALSKGWQG